VSLDRAVLAVSAAFVLLAGFGCLVAPGGFAQQVGFQTAPSSLTEVRAFYGGLQIGIGVFLVWCLRRPPHVSLALLLVALAVGGAGLARAFGMLFDHTPTTHHLTNLGIEIATVVLVVFALVRSGRWKGLTGDEQ